ncbi:MAG: TlpA family protein disulfide reductase [Clostridia bacterium]|nr:TlpA family protein disulfide reductase [Clostridia bacterium]
MKRFWCACLALILAAAVCFAAAEEQEEKDAFYTLGDTVGDFVLTTPEGEAITLSVLLQKYRAVLLNFWFAGCGPSLLEFPFLNDAYHQFGADVAIIGITPYDSDEAIAEYREIMGVDFPLVRDTAGLAERFVDYGYPTTVLIDRFGTVCYSECGAQTGSDIYARLFAPYITEDYTMSLLITVIPGKQIPDPPAPDELKSALCPEGDDFSFFIPEGNWPFLVSDSGDHVVSSNGGYDSTISAVSAVFEAQEGDALRFRFNTSSEVCYDALQVQLDDVTQKTFSGENGWRTYTLPIETEGEHTVTFLYTKDSLYYRGEDRAMLSGLQLLHGDEARQALKGNPVFPQLLEESEVQLDLLNSSVREIRFWDPQGAVNAYYGADYYFLLPDPPTEARVRLGIGCDADAAYIDTLESACTLSQCAADRFGFRFLLPAADPDLGWGALIIHPSSDPYDPGIQICLYFETEEALDYFCLAQVPDPLTGLPIEGLTWDYMN